MAGLAGVGRVAKVRFSMADLVVATVPLAAVLARPQAADAAKISTRLYMPTMLLKDSMPAGLTDLESVPTLRATSADDDFEARLADYVRAIRATSAVFAVANHKEKTRSRRIRATCSGLTAGASSRGSAATCGST